MEKFFVIDSQGRKCTAVIYSPYYGAGFSTWSSIRPDNGKVAEWLFMKQKTLIDKAASQNDYDIYEISCNHQEFKRFLEDSGYSETYINDQDLHIVLLPVGTVYRINEYDGSESIEIYNSNNYYTA